MAKHGNTSFLGFWYRRCTCVFDIHITDTISRSYQNWDPSKVRAVQEKENKDKYLSVLNKQRNDFTQLVYSVDGLAGREVRVAERHIVALIVAKWPRPYSVMVHCIWVLMALAIVKSNSLLTHGSRDCQQACCPVVFNQATKGDWWARPSD